MNALEKKLFINLLQLTKSQNELLKLKKERSKLILS